MQHAGNDDPASGSPHPGQMITTTANTPISQPFEDRIEALRQQIRDHVSGRQRLPLTFELPQSRFAFWTALETLGEAQGSFAYWGEVRAQLKRELTMQSLCNFNSPLSVDHELFVLIQHNAIRGVMANMSLLLQQNGNSFTDWDDFYTEDLPTPPSDVNSPPCLRPTYFQKTIPHESWIDVIPYPALRDNIIKSKDTLDDDALCDDFLGGMYEGLSEVESRGLILWGEPWSDGGWEISEGFVRKWAFLLKGCEDLLRSTNMWREARGEERIVVEL